MEEPRAATIPLLCNNLPHTAQQLKEIINEMCSDTTNQVTLRGCLHVFGEELASHIGSPEMWDAILDVGQHILNLLKTTLVVHDDQIGILYETVADIYEKREEWSTAAEKLTAIPLESGQSSFSNDYRLHIYLRIAALYLEEGDPYRAETFTTRATVLVTETQDAQLKLKFKVQNARVMDAQCNFEGACRRYLELSYIIPDEEARQMALTQAVNCAVLSPAGKARSRHLASLYKDERTRHLPSSDLLASMYFGRIVRKPELSLFASQLEQHQRALTSDNIPLLDRAVLQHNVLAANEIYHNISFEELGLLLEVSSEKAEEIVAQLMTEDRLQGTIDQVEGRVYFANAGNSIAERDVRIAEICNHVNRISHLIHETTDTSF